MNLKPISSKFSACAPLALGALLSMFFWEARAAATDLANVPLANAPTTVILPNVAFVFDDSGSMDEENMPNGNLVNQGSYCYKWHKYNTLAYNPATSYLPPIKADGTRYPNASFTAALHDGYFAAGAKMFDGTTTNVAIDLTTVGSYSLTQSSIVFDSLVSSKYYVSSLKVTKVDGTELELLNSTAVPSSSGTSTTDDLGRAVAESINIQAETSGSGFSAAWDDGSNALTINAPENQSGMTINPVIVRNKVSGTNRSASINPWKTESHSGIFYATHKTDPGSTSCALNSSYNVVSTASGIAAPETSAGSDAALTNYANWYSYYRKRAFLAKAGVGKAFANLDQDKYRIGLFFINSVQSGVGSTNNDLAIGTFSGTHRTNWFNRLYGARKSTFTPLRGALSRMGRMYAGQIDGWDPVQYSCQRNFTILSTDGYWNNNNESTSYGPKKMDGSTNVDDQDGVSGVTRPSLDSVNAQNTLADVAYYYYHTDLRSGTCASPDVCTNNVPPSGTDPKTDDMAQHQHMTTFTVGLGVNGSLTYQSGYKTSTSGDYFDIKQGTKNWPSPVDGSNDTKDRIDDLWHAAVNGHGAYFSANDPASLSTGLTGALNSIESTTGSGAAAATSNLQPTAGDNAIYIATYRTLKWDGEMSAYSVDVSTGAISTSATWQAASKLAEKIGTAGNSDTRTIYTANGTTRIEFKKADSGGLTGTQLAYFDNTKLSQYDAGWGANATAETLVNYLRGHDRLENQDRPGDYGTYHRFYRDREKVLGDIIHAQPVYVKAPPHAFADEGYLAFKTAQAARAGTVYAASNDGMLHAFDAVTGAERWAYIPPMLLPELWRLADEDYGSNHRFYLDGPLAMSDAYIGDAWKTVLIGAMGKGGRGYYALDVTDPTSPQPLWHYTADDNPKVGYSFGTPYITKLADGTWVAVLTSGYNNIPEGDKYATADGKGYVFVLNLETGAVERTITTNVGTSDAPSGLARLNVQVSNFDVDNTAQAAYGGDLLGNMWRFNLNDGTVAKVVALGADKPIMVAPEIASIEDKKVILFGTGRYLGVDDLDDERVQTIYAVKDDGATLVNDPATQLVQKTVSTSGSTRTITSSTVNWASKFGWFMDLADTGERVSSDLQLYFGTLVVATTVPTATECQPGGYSWLYQLDYMTGGMVAGATFGAQKYTSPIVGLTVAKLTTGTPVIYPITADGKKPDPTTLRIAAGGGAGNAKRILWRELND